MARDILGEYGPESSQPQQPRSKGGGEMPVRDVMNYKPPQGPIGIMRPGAPGLGGANLGNCGTQGPKPSDGDGGAGSPGIGGRNKGMGTNRG